VKKALWLPLAAAGLIITLLAAGSLFQGGTAGKRLLGGYPPVYVGVAGVALLTAGLLIKNAD
jgi:hypothetical protein